MELLALALGSIATVTFGIYVTVKCTKAERAHMAEVQAIRRAQAQMSQFKREELKRLLASRKV